MGILCFQAQPEHQEAMYKLRQRVYVKHGYLEADDQRELDIDEYDSHAIHFVAVERQSGKMVGTIRLIRSSCRVFPTEQYFNFELCNQPFAGVTRFQIVEVSRLAVEQPKGYPSHAVMLALIKTIFSYCINNDLMHWYLAADRGAFLMLRRLHFYVEKLGSSRLYLGSETVPAFIQIRQGLQKLREKDPLMATFLTSGVADQIPSKFAWFEYPAAS